jgi:hypothetical protein
MAERRLNTSSIDTISKNSGENEPPPELDFATGFGVVAGASAVAGAATRKPAKLNSPDAAHWSRHEDASESGPI